MRQSEARRQLGVKETDVVHLFFGLIRPYKGLHVLIEAMKDLPENHASWSSLENAMEIGNLMPIDEKVADL